MLQTRFFVVYKRCEAINKLFLLPTVKLKHSFTIRLLLGVVKCAEFGDWTDFWAIKQRPSDYKNRKRRRDILTRCEVYTNKKSIFNVL
ncbi:hypothetical protein L596_002452 [Steinernema carpocapsae]|uniref:Uncharacterized protein n=1 Tax=Steinernema carpocapsae TaxID=34508 RepID=A0A4U8UQA7_STECR|nr:hypothetical protein L596_002452 [Steinernema carpocapsae]